MIIKRNKHPTTTSEDKETLQQTPMQPVDPEEDIWDQLAFEAGHAQDRRHSDRRRGYRRAEEKHLVATAYEEAVQIRENAYRDGFEDGLRQAESALEDLRHSLGQLMQAQEEAMLTLVEDIAPIAIEVAERILKTEVSCDESLVLSMVRDTIQRAGRKVKTLTIKVNPTDAKLVKQDLKANPLQNVPAELIVLDDPTVDVGSCIVETDSGLIDATFSTQMELLRALFGQRTEGG